MTKNEFSKISGYMTELSRDSAHDINHIYRVLYMALDIAETEPSANMDVLIAACLLHDIGRERQAQDLTLNHAEIGAEMAYEYLTGIGWSEEAAAHVKSCVQTHRFRRGKKKPESIEAAIVFDADKLDVTGAVGIARTLIYSGQITEPLYRLTETGALVTSGEKSEKHAFLEEYDYKLRKMYDVYHTKRAKEIALSRQRAAENFYANLVDELEQSHNAGRSKLEGTLT